MDKYAQIMYITRQKWKAIDKKAAKQKQYTKSNDLYPSKCKIRPGSVRQVWMKDEQSVSIAVYSGWRRKESISRPEVVV
jgi:hypothetical protein